MLLPCTPTTWLVPYPELLWWGTLPASAHTYTKISAFLCWKWKFQPIKIELNQIWTFLICDWPTKLSPISHLVTREAPFVFETLRVDLDETFRDSPNRELAFKFCIQGIKLLQSLFMKPYSVLHFGIKKVMQTRNYKVLRNLCTPRIIWVKHTLSHMWTNLAQFISCVQPWKKL